MITSTTNSRVKEARKLHSRRHRQQARRLLLEGITLIADAFDAGVRPHQLFYLAGIADHNAAAANLLDRAQAAGISTAACSRQVLDVLTTTVTSQGMVAVVAMPELPLPEVPSLYVILDGIRDPGNAGTLLRSAEAAGAEALICAPGTVDPFNEKVVRAAMGAHFRVPIRVCPDWDAVRNLLSAGQRLFVADAAGQIAYDRIDWIPSVALVIGSEASGPSHSALALAQGVSIPMLGRAESLNAAMAGSVILFEAARQRRAAETG